MRIVWRAALVVLVFAGVGWLTDRAVLRHSADAGMYQPQVRMGAAMAGLFGGGVAATITALVVILARKKRADV